MNELVDIHAQRVKSLDALDEIKIDYLKYEKREKRWKFIRPKVLAAPLVAACVLVSPGIKEKNRHHPDRILGIETGALFVAVGSFILADERRKAAFLKAREEALLGARYISELGMATPGWVEQGLRSDTDPNPVEIKEAA